MRQTNPLPRALLGGVLSGTRVLRFVYMDEAGTSAARHEKVRVVASVLVHADEQLLFAEAALNEALGDVPPEFRENFIFHAEDIMNNKKYRDRWRLTDRVNLICKVMSIPKRLGMPICFGSIASTTIIPESCDDDPLTLSERQHLLAFVQCITMADHWIREHGAHNEVAILVCEKSDFSRVIKLMPASLRENAIILPPGSHANRDIDDRQGFNSQIGVMRISRIRDRVHFVDKTEEDMVWIADACAYGIKRMLAKLEFGDLFHKALTDFPLKMLTGPHRVVRVDC